MDIGTSDLTKSLLDSEDMKIICKDTCDAYIKQISDMVIALKQTKELTNLIADSLAGLDPNMENGEEGKALIKRIYSFQEDETEESSPIMPETPKECIGMVAGKVIQIENLNEDITEAKNFRDFFAHVYCDAYATSLVTLKGSLKKLNPESLDRTILKELERISGGDLSNNELMEF